MGIMMMKIATEIDETLYRISEQEGKGCPVNEKECGEMSGHLLIINWKEDADTSILDAGNIPLYVTGQVFDDLTREVSPDLMGVFYAPNTYVWNVQNQGTHILVMHNIKGDDDSLNRFGTVLYDSVYEEATDLFREMHSVVGTRGYYTPGSYRRDMFHMLMNLYLYAYVGGDKEIALSEMKPIITTNNTYRCFTYATNQGSRNYACKDFHIDLKLLQAFARMKLNR